MLLRGFRRARQLQSALEIDWSNPITRGLVLAFIPGIGDITRNCQRLNTYALSTGRFGKQTGPLTAAPFPELGPRNVKNGGAISVIVFGTFAPAGSFTAPLISHYPGSGGWKFGVDSSGNIGYTHYSVADYTTTVGISGFTGAIGMTATIGSAARMFKGGVFQQSIAIGSINSAGVSGNFSIGSRFGPTDSTSASVVALTLYFERGLTDGEHASLIANPDQIFKAQSPVYLYVQSGASVPNGDFTSILSGATMAASGATTNPGTFASTLAGCTMAAAGSVGSAPSGAFASTLAGCAMAASGAIVVPGVFASTLGGVTMASTGSVINRGALAATLDGMSMAAAGMVAANATGTFASTLDGASMAAYGYNGIPPALPDFFLRLPRNPRHIQRRS